MSQPRRDAGLSLTNSSPRPSYGQSSVSSVPSFSNVPQSVLSQRLIPRDFLGTRAKPSTGAVPIAAVPESKNQEANRFLWNSRQVLSSPADRGLNNNRDGFIRDRTSIPDRDFLANDELKANRTRSPELVESPSSIKSSDTVSSTFGPSYSDPTSRPTMPRTSSIDSAISNVSVTSLHRAAGEMRDPSPASVRNLIESSGGAESLVTHLLRDKNSISSQNAQLWKLVDKQRALLLGLNKDLERITKERDKYKKTLKDLHDRDNNHSAETSQQSSQLENTIASAGNRDNSGQKIPLESLSLQPNITVTASSPNSNSGEPFVDHNKENAPVNDFTKPTIAEVAGDREQPTSGQQPLMPKLNTLTAMPVFNVIEASPLVEKANKSTLSNRKAPPKPLNLVYGKSGETAPVPGDMAAESVSPEDEQDRGRRRTREEDDRDRELSAMKMSVEPRSRSKKDVILKSSDEEQMPIQTQIVAPAPTPGLPLSPRPQHAQTFVAPQSGLSVNNTSQSTTLGDRLLGAPLKSPGLPLSPRPMNQLNGATIANSLPLSPRANMSTFPLSPRAPKHALPVPTNPSAPADAATLQKASRSQPQVTAQLPIDRLQTHEPIGSEPPPVYRGLAVSSYPNLLLPPNALPSIQVKVHSSRLRPSRHSVLGLKSQEELTVFSLSIISRSSNSELWRVEKVPAQLPQLEQQLRPRCPELPRMPERKLFTGHSPAILDERRTAVDTYFDELLDTHVDEQAAITICRFLSTDVVDPEGQIKTSSGTSNESLARVASPEKLLAKTGYLTKKGKSFGGWKSRYFVLEGGELRYYESSGGQHLGTIRLHNALIGKQRESETTDDVEGQFRHAFLIQEAKRKDSAAYIRHVLCAESDAERDDWVRILLYWVEASTSNGISGRSDQESPIAQGANEHENHYQSSKVGANAREILQSTKETHNNTPTPTSISSVDSSILDQPSVAKPTNISAPMNGGVITDAAAWGHKSMATGLPREPRDKSYKMGNIFGFKKPDHGPAPAEQKPAKPRILRHNGYVRPVFGLPLAEAVEFCAPFNVEVNLPAVIYRCIEYLRYRDAANEEGLFRLSGSNVVIRALKERFNTEGDVDLVSEDEHHDVHAVASLFKTYLRELPSTLLTRDLHIEFIKVLELESNAEKIVAFNNLVHQLPPANFDLLRELSSYLVEVTLRADKNKMSVRNVGIVFSPTLNIPTPVFTLFLTEFAAIFENWPTVPSVTRTTEINISPTSSIDDSDVRSPRHQMFTDLPTPAPHQASFPNQAALIPPRGTMTGTGELGFMPIHPSYESGNYVSVPRNGPIQPVQPMTQVAEAGGYGSLNSLLAPTNAASEKAKRRESAIFFTG